MRALAGRLGRAIRVITDPTATVALSNLGWVDHGSVWRFDTRSGHASALAIGDAEYLHLLQGTGEYFAVQHHWSGERWRVSAHIFSEPEQAVSTIEVRGWSAEVSGEIAAWRFLPRVYVGYLDDDATGAAGYYTVTVGDGGHLTVDRLDWFDDGYDHLYQGVVSVTQLSAGAELAFGVQRSSELVLVNPRDQQVRRKVQLADRGGNPHPVVSRTGPTVWVSDYDTVVRLDGTRWSVERAVLLQPPAPSGTRMFVGDVWLPHDESYVLVPRPESSDVVRLDSVTLSILDVIPLGQQPLTAAVLDHSLVVARDWKSGDLLLGHLPPRSKLRKWRRSS